MKSHLYNKNWGSLLNEYNPDFIKTKTTFEYFYIILSTLIIKASMVFGMIDQFKVIVLLILWSLAVLLFNNAIRSIALIITISSLILLKEKTISFKPSIETIFETALLLAILYYFIQQNIINYIY